MSKRDGKSKSRVFLQLTGAFGILGSTLPLGLVLLATFLSTWFSWNVNALSELGVGDQAALFNSAVLLGGVLSLLFDFGLHKYLGREKVIRVGVVSLMLSSVSLALIGIFTIKYLVPHGIVALSFFVLAPVGFLLIGTGTRDGTIRKLSFACGIAALLAIVGLPLIAQALPFKVGIAVPELAESLAISVWTIYMSATLLLQPQSKRQIENQT